MIKFSKKTIKLAFFSILPAIILLVGGEAIVRLFALDRPFIIAGDFIGPNTNVQADSQLGWSLKPNFSAKAKWGDYVKTNKLGLRSPEVLPKDLHEFRILSLGESSTYGVGVSDSETYSALLQEHLNKTIQSKLITVVNAGVSAYSSFQSLKYLELRGLKLNPDLILFYHELNDYLPSAVRGRELDEVGILKTDKQLYDSKLQKLNRILTKWLAFYRFLEFSYSKYKINNLNRGDFKNPLLGIGLPEGRIGSRFLIVTDQGTKPAKGELDAVALGRRVSEKERLGNLDKLCSICNDSNIHLIIIHPSYRYSKLHECLLTQFCRDNNVLMFEAYPTLHPENIPVEAMFIDAWHPTELGHECLANGLSHFIYGNIFRNYN